MLLPLPQTSKWVFLGDTGMAHIPYFLSRQWPFEGNFTTTTRRNPCQSLMYYGLPPPDHGWKAPSLGEGPAKEDRPFCSDCSNCWNVGLNSSDLSVEYLVVEYARDVSVPSQVTATTQETVAFYLNHQYSYSEKPICVASAGVHDAAIQPPLTQDNYLRNVEDYLGRLLETCDSVIWINLHAVVETKDTVQRNCRLQQWKNGFLEIISDRSYDNVYVMDIWEKSFHADFVRPTQLGQKFYASLARLFRSLMAGPNVLT